MSYGRQGAASRDFLRSLKDMINYYKIDILGLLKPRVLGDLADEICRKLGYGNYICLGGSRWF